MSAQGMFALLAGLLEEGVAAETIEAAIDRAQAKLRADRGPICRNALERAFVHATTKRIDDLL